MFSLLANRPRRSAILRIGLLQVAFLGLAALALGMGTHVLLRSYLTHQTGDMIEAELVRLTRGIGLNEVADDVKAAVTVARENPAHPFVYLLADENGRCWYPAPHEPERCVVGNLLTWPKLRFDADGWAHGSVELSGRYPISVIAKEIMIKRDPTLMKETFARQVLPDTALRLLVAHPLASERDLLLKMINMVALGVAIFFMCASAAVWFATRRILRRLEMINAVCGEIGIGGMNRRIEVESENDEFAELGHNINGMLDRITNLMRELENVTSYVAHELKQPLTRLRAKLERFLETDAACRGDAVVYEGIRELDVVLNMFRTLLDVASIEASGTQRFGQLDLSEPVRDVVELYTPVAEDLAITLSSDIQHAEIWGNRPFLTRLVCNLLDNALKFTPSGGHVRVVATPYPDHAELVVSDTGPGIPDSQKSEVFEPCMRGKGSQDKPGFGLGLTLVRAVARQHQAEITLEDNAPGLRIRVSFPCRKPIIASSSWTWSETPA
jgi:signal transduction histidine kinase